MGKNISKHEKRKKQQAEKLQWALRAWQCDTLADAKRLARTDTELKKVLQSCGIKF